MVDIDVIIPLHEYNKEIKPLLHRALKSVPEDIRVIIVTPNYDTLDVKEVESVHNYIMVVSPNQGEEPYESDFCSLVNKGVNVGEVKEWFSILEFDDEYTDIWFNNVEKYVKYYPETSVFLPLEELIDYNNGKFIGYGNEAPWATSFSNEIGYIDNDCLQQYFDFYLTGGVFNKKDWNNCGGLKSSIKVSFWYEYLLRLTSKDKKVLVIPKLGYKHYVDRDGSLYDQYRKTIDDKESNWWFDLARQESVFSMDRNKTYEAYLKENE